MSDRFELTHAVAPAADDRFAFGENWAQFAERISDARVESSRRALAEMLGVDDLRGKSFLDAGSGSGLSSLAAHELGASPIHAFDFDPDSVQTTIMVRDRRAPNSEWKAERGDVLDAKWLAALGQFDIVHSWGVLHHTGDLWRAFDNVAQSVAPGGILFVSIYNDQGRRSLRWRRIKRTYNRIPHLLRAPFAVLVAAPMELRLLLSAVLRGRLLEYLHRWAGQGRDRGMSRWNDLLDWVGGYPFEVATPDEVLAAGRRQGLNLVRMRTAGGGHGCNEFVFQREPGAPPNEAR